ncbi:DUF6194 family protein [Parasphingorhabdus litoris]|uniref:DUF6194 family protein n=1 Tax=Parasphingorhabdus litoris TaxID=394733 RepID=A0ABN1AGN2_9SPHN|nr:DUF6194 family protein [Parasphingorhabdus litoris]
MADLNIQTAIDHLASLDGVNVVQAWGETAFFHNPGDRLPRGTYFATIKEKDGENDQGSHLDREGVWRLNIGTPVKAFEELFGPRPPRPAKGKTVEGPWDFTELDRLIPHPSYGWIGWIAVLNPSIGTWARCKPLIAHARDKAIATFDKKIKG